MRIRITAMLAMFAALVLACGTGQDASQTLAGDTPPVSAAPSADAASETAATPPASAAPELEDDAEEKGADPDDPGEASSADQEM